ncbi:FAD-dependent monooxygenase [Streptomyces sp. NPDC001076]
MRDAVNLAWRLDPVLAGRASTSVLDSYGPERLAHVAPLVQGSLMTWSLAAETDPEKAAAGDAFLRPTQQRARTAERTAFRSGLPVPKRAAR